MAVESGYDTTNLQTLSLELQRLNAAAVKTGLLRPSDVMKLAPLARTLSDTTKTPTDTVKTSRGTAGRSKPSSPAAADRRGKRRAKRLLALLRRADDDGSPDVIGTDFTEDGVVRLLAHLGKPRSRQSLFLRKMERFLLRPCAYGVRTAAGIGVERLQLVARQLAEIETQGWTYFQARRAARRTRETREAAEPDRVTPVRTLPGRTNHGQTKRGPKSSVVAKEPV